MNIRKTLGVVAIATGLGITFAPGVAHAHTFNHQVGCGGLSWSATLYESQQTNSIVVTIDGAVAYSDASFGTTDTGNIPWSQTSNHSYSIVVNAPGTIYDHNVSGVQQACQTTTTPETTTTTICVDCTPNTQVITVPPTTQPSSTTSVPPSTDPSTTSSVPGTTLPVDSTTSLPPSNPTDPPTPPTPPPTALPATGSDTNMAVIAITLIGIGAVMFRLASKPSR